MPVKKVIGKVNDIPVVDANDVLTYRERLMKYRLASDPRTSSDVLRKLAKLDDWGLKVRVVENRSVPRDVLVLLSEDVDNRVRSAVARCFPDMPAEIFERLRTDEDGLCGLCRNPYLPANVLSEFAQDSITCAAVARNIGLPESILRELANYDTFVRCNLAQNPSTPSDVLESLSSDADKEVRENVAKNPSLSPDVLRDMVNEEYRSMEADGWFVSNLVMNALANPSCPLDVMKDALERYKDRDYYMDDGRPEFVLEPLAANPNASPEVLSVLTERYLSACNDYFLKTLVKNPNLSEEDSLKVASGYIDDDVCRALAEHTSYPGVLDRLVDRFRDERYEIEFMAVCGNPHLSEDTALKIARRKLPVRVHRELAAYTPYACVLDELSRSSKDDSVLLCVCENPAVRESTLRSLSGCDSAVVLKAVLDSGKLGSGADGIFHRAYDEITGYPGKDAGYNEWLAFARGQRKEVDALRKEVAELKRRIGGKVSQSKGMSI